MDLEVDHRWRDTHGKIADSFQNEKILASGLDASDEVALKPTASISQAKPRRFSAFCVFIALAVGIALAAIAAGVAGSIAVQRQSRLKSYEFREPKHASLNPI